MLSTRKLFLTVIRAFVTDTKIDEAVKPQFTPDVLEAMFEIAKTHDVLPIVSDTLYKNGLLPKDAEITQKFQKQQLAALQRYMNIENEQQKLYKLFRDSAITFMPLKGSVIRQYYPQPYMRTSCDIDLLVREEDLDRAVEAVITKLGYQKRNTVSYHDVSLFSPTNVHFELHFNLKEKRENLDKLLIKVWDYSMDTDKGQYYKLQTPEFFIFHHIAHMMNHFLRGGCGIRTFIDLYYIEKYMAYDAAKVAALMEETGLTTFYQSVLQCVGTWFGDETPTEVVGLIEAFILKGGVFGTRENRINIDQTRQGGKFQYYLSRVFLPYNTLKYKYPVLRKHKILLPLLWFIRIFSFLSPKKRARAQHDLQIQHAISADAEKSTNKMLDLLEI